MSILTDELQSTIVVVGEEVEINTDFRAWIEFSQKITTVNDNESVIKLVSKVLNGLFPPLEYFDETIRQLTAFMIGEKKENRESAKELTFDFDYDADIIFSSFWQQYGIDLSTANLHWKKFLALLNGLSEKTLFGYVSGIRTIDLNEIKDKEQRAYYAKQKDKYRLPISEEEQKIKHDLAEALKNGGDVNSILNGG